MSLSSHQLAEIVRTLGGERITTYANKVQCSCLLARWTHTSGRDSHPSMVLYTEGDHGPTYGCLGCGESGTLRDLVLFMWSKTGTNLFDLVDLIDGEGSPDAPAKISEKLRKKATEASTVGFETRRLTPKARPIEQLQDGKPFYDYQCIAKADAAPELPPETLEQYAGSVPRYAVDRGLTIETCKAWELGNNRKGRRLVIPMRDHQGKLLALTGRLYACPRCGFHGEIDEAGERHWTEKPEGERERCQRCKRSAPPKYFHSKGFKRNLLLFGEHRRKLDPGRKVYLAEGHLDVILLWQLGYRPVVGMMGSNPGAAQIEKLIRYWERVIIVPDGDDAGDKLVSETKRMVAGRIPVGVRKLPRGSDPGKLAKLAPETLREILGPPPSDVDEAVVTG